ncbi:E3 ubiquitin ligase TRAF3IP2 isoform X2 [Nerophis lumbriciformis]|uniref:E3 ubiquitin ligase TRAF3IP2 isoform X2 n=1 Tax=Nerophis lumbriciformis TaxID=546530 RepID=UPI002ADFD5E7|nr:E3 ubiquitin ligase TRAF3IP2-like isoform X2 [Nerophis lumbriciformis]
MLPGSKSPNSWFLGDNTPQEDDETMSCEQRPAGPDTDSTCARLYHPDSFSDPSHLSPPDSSSDPSLPGARRPDGEDGHLGSCSFPPAPFPSLADGVWPPPSGPSGDWSGYPSSAASSKEPCGCCGESKSLSSLEQPFSLRSEPPSRHHTLPPYMCSPPGAACWAQCPADTFNIHPCFQQKRADQGPQCPCRLPWGAFTPISHFSGGPGERQTSPSMPLSLEQRKVFVTYEADHDAHVSEIIKFVALLRHNGFDTHIDIFEQQFRSISKIDFMERYLGEEYLIIIIISPKYYETVTASHVSPDIDERACNAVYIHKQLQTEFIQNGSKNFRFIPIVFPGAKKCHVPTWLQNTHVYAWPLDRDDILRRLMRVEKYNPPPIGELPTIVSIPI